MMDNKQNRFISVSYQLHSIEKDGTRHLEEQTQQGNPYRFISGFGFSIDAFEQKLVGLEQGAKFDFMLSPDETFGQYDAEGVHRMKREDFEIDGHFDEDNIYPGAVITMVNNEDQRFLARVTQVDSDSVTLDTNHPLAGMTLQFTGLVLENREATKQEIQEMLNQMSCGCGGDCEGGCEGGCGGCH